MNQWKRENFPDQVSTKECAGHGLTSFEKGTDIGVIKFRPVWNRDEEHHLPLQVKMMSLELSRYFQLK